MLPPPGSCSNPETNPGLPRYRYTGSLPSEPIRETQCVCKTQSFIFTLCVELLFIHPFMVYVTVIRSYCHLKFCILYFLSRVFKLPFPHPKHIHIGFLFHADFFVVVFLHEIRNPGFFFVVVVFYIGLIVLTPNPA